MVKMDGRTCKLLTYQDIIRTCYLEFVFISDNVHVFFKAWRKKLAPINSLDNSDYPQKNRWHGDWTIQTDGWWGKGDHAHTDIKEMRSDDNCLKDINAHLSYTREHYPDVPTYFFKQEYADWEEDMYVHKVVRLRFDEEIVPRDYKKKAIVLQPNEQVVAVPEGMGLFLCPKHLRPVGLGPNEIIVKQNPGERIITVAEGNLDNKYLDGIVFHSCTNGVTAFGEYRWGGCSFVLLKDSEVNLSLSPTSQAGIKRRKEELDNGVIVKKGRRYYITDELGFRSSNAAADFAFGGKNIGETTWMDKFGRTIKEVKKLNKIIK